MYYRTVIEFEVLSNEPYEFINLHTLDYDITEGECSGRVCVTTQEEVTRERMTELLLDQGSDPAFLLGDEEEE